MSTIRLTMAQALVRWLVNQFIIVDGKEEPVFPGVFGIFGHGTKESIKEAQKYQADVRKKQRVGV